MDVNTALREGPLFLKNAQDALAREIKNPDLLYQWDNEVAAIDAFLADTEPFANEDADLKKLREDLRDAKKGLERKIVTFEAQQEGEEPPEDPSEEELVIDFKEFAQEILNVLKEALDKKVQDVKELPAYEEPRDLANGFLADSEPYKENQELAGVRSEVQALKLQIDARIHEITDEWRKKDISASA
jgi:hypothetical protein